MCENRLAELSPSYTEHSVTGLLFTLSFLSLSPPLGGLLTDPWIYAFPLVFLHGSWENLQN